MPNYDITVPASSPLFRYPAGSWSFHENGSASCTLRDCSFDFTFAGTGINLPIPIFTDNITTFVDGRKSEVITGNKGGPPSLPRVENLTPGHHTLQLNSTSLIESDGVNLILTTVVITMGDGETSTTALSSIIDDEDSNNFTYSRSEGDSFINCSVCNGGGAHFLGGYGHFANISFHGNDVALYGYLQNNKTQSSYDVTLDGQPADSWPAVTNIVADIHGVLLYQSGNLTLGSHYVLIQTNGTDLSGLALDYADVRTYVNASASSVTSTGVLSTSTSKTTFTSITPTAVIVGGVLGGLALIAVVISYAFFLIRRRFRRTRFTFVGEDGIDGGDPPARPEEDMPPPDYQRVFAHESIAATGPHAPASSQRELRDGHPSAFGRLLGGKRQRHPAPAVTDMSGPQYRLTNVAEANPDQSILARREQPPMNFGERSSKGARGKK